MANKTIYIAEPDLPIFEKAQQLAGDNLSSTIIRALREFITSEQIKRKEFEEITVKVGKAAPYEVKRFTGRLLKRKRILNEDKTLWYIITVYLTMKSKFAVHTANISDWSAWTNRSEEDWSSASKVDWSVYYQDKEWKLEVYETLEELQGSLPDDLYESIVRSLRGEEIEYLDI